ncbi:hypothetical protein HYX02_06975 [Candidatus Woesearchaeota archaeon]|nr:hypothetical protein [Candidatus Woesearchaeota archaeon]
MYAIAISDILKTDRVSGNVGINATGEVGVKKLKAEIIEADNIGTAQQLTRIQEVNGSVIIRLG